jgi:hypothetical protein
MSSEYHLRVKQMLQKLAREKDMGGVAMGGLRMGGLMMGGAEKSQYKNVLKQTGVKVVKSSKRKRAPKFNTWQDFLYHMRLLHPGMKPVEITKLYGKNGAKHSVYQAYLANPGLIISQVKKASRDMGTDMDMVMPKKQRKPRKSTGMKALTRKQINPVMELVSANASVKDKVVDQEVNKAVEKIDNVVQTVEESGLSEPEKNKVVENSTSEIKDDVIESIENKTGEPLTTQEKNDALDRIMARIEAEGEGMYGGLIMGGIMKGLRKKGKKTNAKKAKAKKGLKKYTSLRRNRYYYC